MDINDINKYFAELGSGSYIDNELLQRFETNSRDASPNLFTLSDVTSLEVKETMNEIKSNAVGSDDISIRMIKAVSPYALGAITHLINKSINSGRFPTSWKLSVVHPIPKVAAPKCVQQMRPISILPAMSKILEKIVSRQMESHMNARNILPKRQSGFRKDHGTCTALLNLFTDLIDAKDRGLYSSIVLLDFSQAFDSISHKLLLAKMQYYGFGAGTVEWVRSYLNSRCQVTRLGEGTSAVHERKSGVPQGSCLGPLLFNLYTSDFLSAVHNCTPHMYADDCQLHLSFEPNSVDRSLDLINSDLKRVCEWAGQNGLNLNISKCTVLHVCPQQVVQDLEDRRVGVVLGGQLLAVSEKVKTLGVILDRGLTFTDHVTYTIHRVLGRLRGLYRFRELLPESAKVQLTHSLVLSPFYYCYPAYGNSVSAADTDRIQMIQNKAVRFIFNLRRFDHVSAYREAIGLMPMGDVCKMMTICLVHRVLSLRAPQYLSERLRRREELSLRVSRHGSMLHIPQVSRELGRRSFSYFGPTLYNGLPATLKTKPLSTFRAAYKAM